jgi:hypothetical protein
MFKSHSRDLQEQRKRAEEIRGSWSSSERRRRTGLPPDAPTKLRDYVLAIRNVNWWVESPTVR